MLRIAVARCRLVPLVYKEYRRLDEEREETRDDYTQRNMVWGNLWEFILVNIKAMNEVVHSRKDSVNLFNEDNRLRVGCHDAFASVSIFNADIGQNK